MLSVDSVLLHYGASALFSAAPGISPHIVCGAPVHVPAGVPHFHRRFTTILSVSVLHLLHAFFLISYYLRSNTRSFALLERLLYSISSSVGKIGFRVSILPRDFFPHTQTGKSGGQVHGFSFRLKFVLTIRSSKEWKVIMQSLPPGFSIWIISSKES